MSMPVEPQSPISMDMIMSMRKQAQGSTDMQGAAQRRLQGLQGQDSNSMSMQEDPLAVQSPEEMIVSDQQNMAMQEEPPDINPSAAKRMIQYGAVMDYLKQARGEISAQQ